MLEREVKPASQPALGRKKSGSQERGAACQRKEGAPSGKRSAPFFTAQTRNK